MAQIERRHPRLRRPLPARWVEITGPRAAKVIDLSVGGCCLQTELTPPPLGERVLLQLQFADRPLVIAGKVAWAEMGRRFGVMFDVVSSEQRARLVQQLKAAGMADPAPTVGV